VNVGQTIFFKSHECGLWRIDIYRLGYYQGSGARLVTSVSPRRPCAKPTSLSDRRFHWVNRCGNWAVSASWAVPARHSELFCQTRPAGHRGGESVIFVVRNDSSAPTFGADVDQLARLQQLRWEQSLCGNPHYKVSLQPAFNVRI